MSTKALIRDNRGKHCKGKKAAMVWNVFDYKVKKANSYGKNGIL